MTAKLEDEILHGIKALNRDQLNISFQLVIGDFNAANQVQVYSWLIRCCPRQNQLLYLKKSTSEIYHSYKQGGIPTKYHLVFFIPSPSLQIHHILRGPNSRAPSIKKFSTF